MRRKRGNGQETSEKATYKRDSKEQQSELENGKKREMIDAGGHAAEEVIVTLRNRKRAQNNKGVGQ